MKLSCNPTKPQQRLFTATTSRTSLETDNLSVDITLAVICRCILAAILHAPIIENCGHYAHVIVLLLLALGNYLDHAKCGGGGKRIETRESRSAHGKMVLRLQR